MEITLEVTFEGSHALAIANGDKDYHYMDRLRRGTAMACEQHDCYKMPGLLFDTGKGARAWLLGPG